MWFSYVRARSAWLFAYHSEGNNKNNIIILIIMGGCRGAVLSLWFFQDRRADLDRRGLEAANKLEELLADKQLWKVSQGLQGARQFQDTFAPDESA